MGMSIQQLGLSLRFHYVQYPTPGKTSPRFSAESPEKWTIPIHDGSFIPGEVLMGSTHQISRFSLSKGTTCFYNNYSCLTRRHSTHSPRTSLPLSSMTLQVWSTRVLFGSAHNSLRPTFWSIHELASARNASRKTLFMTVSIGE